MSPSRVAVCDRSSTFRETLATILLLLCAQLAPTSAGSQTLPPLASRDTAMTMPGTCTFVRVGDLSLRTPASHLPDQAVQSALRPTRAADVA